MEGKSSILENEQGYLIRMIVDICNKVVEITERNYLENLWQLHHYTSLNEKLVANGTGLR